MAEATTSNQNHGACSTTSDHVAQNSAPDVCLTPNKSGTIPHDNSVNTDKATTHTSDKTQIHDGPGVRQGDNIGAPSKAGDNAVCGKGVASGTCQEEATIVTGSPNVHLEGQPLGRKTDPTKQNHGNTVGNMQGGSPTDEAKALTDEKAQLCQFKTKTVTVVEAGKSVTKVVPDILVKCSHTKGLVDRSKSAVATSVGATDPDSHSGKVGGSATCKGRTPGPENVLEVTSPVEIILKAVRINAKEKDKGPECEEHEHTMWTIKREKGHQPEREDPPVKNKDEYLLKEDWFAWPGQTEVDGSSKSAKDMTDDRTKENREQMAADHPKMLDRNVNKNADRQTRGEGSTISAGADVGALQAGASAVYQLGVQLKEFWEIWHADDEPIKVEVEAEACSGKVTYYIHSFPSQKTTFALSKETADKIQAALQVIAKVFRSAKKVAALGGGDVDGEVHFLEHTSFEASVNWAEMQEDKPAIKKYKHNVDREWTVQLKGEIAKIIVKFGLQVVVFANAFLPGGGTILAKIINWLGLKVTVGVDINCLITTEIGAEKKAGFSNFPLTFTGGFDAAIDLYLKLEASFRDSFEASVGVIVKFNPGITAHLPSADLFAAKITFEPGDIKMGVQGIIKIDTWWYKTDETVSYFPDAFHVSYDGFNVPFLSNVKQ